MFFCDHLSGLLIILHGSYHSILNSACKLRSLRIYSPPFFQQLPISLGYIDQSNVNSSKASILMQHFLNISLIVYAFVIYLLNHIKVICTSVSAECFSAIISNNLEHNEDMNQRDGGLNSKYSRGEELAIEIGDDMHSNTFTTATDMVKGKLPIHNNADMIFSSSYDLNSFVSPRSPMYDEPPIPNGSLLKKLDNFYRKNISFYF